MSEGELSFLNETASEVAPRLLGCFLEFESSGRKYQVRIVETEAYDQTDVASHSYRGETERTKVMFGPAGFLYVYFTYGMHYCANVVVGRPGEGAAVLIRAVEPIDGAKDILLGRRNKPGVALTNGPAKLCQALGITKGMNGHDLRKLPLRLVPGELALDEQVVVTTRIGISGGKDAPWRFYIKDNPYVSVNAAK
jgi:DNA-3-methyladenine glycosylase